MAVGADGVGDAVVVELADACGEVAVAPERLRQADGVRDGLAKELRVGQDAGAVRIKAGEHRIPARAAQRELAVRVLKADAACSELVEVRRFDERMAVAAETVVQIVRHHEEDVRTRAGVGERGGKNDGNG